MEKPNIIHPGVYSKMYSDNTNNDESSCQPCSPDVLPNLCCPCANDSYTCISLGAGFQLCYFLDFQQIRASIQIRFSGIVLGTLELSLEKPISYHTDVGVLALDLDVAFIRRANNRTCLNAKGDIKTLGIVLFDFDTDIICF